MTYDKVKYNNEYNKKNYTELRFRVPKGQKEVIDNHWKEKGYKSFSAYIKTLIEKDMEGGAIAYLIKTIQTIISQGSPIECPLGKIV